MHSQLAYSEPISEEAMKKYKELEILSRLLPNSLMFSSMVEEFNNMTPPLKVIEEKSLLCWNCHKYIDVKNKTTDDIITCNNCLHTYIIKATVAKSKKYPDGYVTVKLDLPSTVKNSNKIALPP